MTLPARNPMKPGQRNSSAAMSVVQPDVRVVPWAFLGPEPEVSAETLAAYVAEQERLARQVVDQSTVRSLPKSR